MVADAVGSLLSLSIAIASSPLPIIAAVFVAGSGRAAGLAFALGWLIGLTGLALLSAFLVRGIGEIGPTGQLLLDVLRAALGVLLLGAALRKWQKRPREGEEPTVPAWLEAFRTMDAPGALRWGAVLAAANPKHVGLVLAAMAYVAEAASTGEALIAVAALVLLSSSKLPGDVAHPTLHEQRYREMLIPMATGPSAPTSNPLPMPEFHLPPSAPYLLG